MQADERGEGDCRPTGKAGRYAVGRARQAPQPVCDVGAGSPPPAARPQERAGPPVERQRNAALEHAIGLQATEGCCLSLRSEEHTSELQSLMRISYAVFCLKKKKTKIESCEIYTHSTQSNQTQRSL